MVWKSGIEKLTSNSVHIFTDGFNLDGEVGEGIYLEFLGISTSKRLLDNYSIFQAQNFRDTCCSSDYTGHVDSQATALVLLMSAKNV